MIGIGCILGLRVCLDPQCCYEKGGFDLTPYFIVREPRPQEAERFRLRLMEATNGQRHSDLGRKSSQKDNHLISRSRSRRG